jgi:hypothetical protein
MKVFAAYLATRRREQEGGNQNIRDLASGSNQRFPEEI